MPTSSDLRPVGLPPGRTDAAADLLARAFWDDPVMVHLLPRAADRYRRLVRLFRFAMIDGRRRGLVHTTPELDAVTVWHAPGRHGTTPTDALRALPQMLRTFPVGRLDVARRTFEALEAAHPREPHWYLSIIGSDPGRRGIGAGRALLEPVLAMADDEGLPAYLESSKLGNVPYYERFGFEVTEQVTLPSDGPPLYLMWRDPHPS